VPFCADLAKLVTEIDKYLWEEEAHMRRVLGGQGG
jgi:hypothetical protein